MKRLLIVLFLGLIVSKLIAQPESPGSLPQMLPPTPTAAELIKVGMGNVNKSTGAVQTNIPLYELSVEDFKMPVAISYMSQGTKVGALSSRVGFGWSLLAGGVITRNVMGMPDERAARAVIPGNLGSNSTQVYNYFYNGKTTNGVADFMDTQPDEFYYNFNGHNGKFVLNDADEAIIITHENLKISVNKSSNDISGITIITPDGIKYFFGNEAFEKTKSDGFMKAAFFSKTAFYLRTVTLLTGTTIDFNYTHIETSLHTGYSETVTTPGSGDDDLPICPAGHFVESHESSFQGIINDAIYLNSIETSTGIDIIFLYENMPDDSNDKRLKSFSVYNQGGLEVCNYHFTYTNCTTSAVNGRFFLTNVYQKFSNPDGLLGEPSVNNIGYVFDYYGNPLSCYGSMSNLYAQDHFGFANGKDLNQTLLPQPGPPDDFNTPIQWADKSYDWNYAVKGTLKKITYPTTGIEEFFYEPNTIPVLEMIPIPSTIHRFLAGSGSSGYGAAHTTYTNTFTVYKSQTIDFHYSSWMGSPCPGGTGAPCDICKVCYIKITDETNGGDVKMNFTAEGLYPLDHTINVVAGHTYKLEIKMTGPSCFHVEVILNYDAGLPDPQWVNKITGGIRLSKIAKTDPVTGNVLNTFFKYHSLAEPTKSSGVGFLKKEYKTTTRTGSCDGPLCGQCYHNVYSSNGVFNLFTFNNSHIYYKNIIQCDDASFANGGVEYTFHDPVMNLNGINVRGMYIPNAPDEIIAKRNGLLKQTRYFDSQLRTKRLEQDEYEIALTGNIVRSIHIRMNYAPMATAPDPLAFEPFDVREINYAQGWIKLLSHRVEEYTDALEKMEKITTYTYTDKENVLPREETTTNSKGEEAKILKKYVSDYTAVPVLSTMKSKYKINALVEETNLVGNTQTGKTEFVYKDWFNDGKVLKPELVKVSESGAAPENRLVYSSYDNTGNITGISKQDGNLIAYLWGHSRALVIAEVKNAIPSDIAFTSFEDDSKGNWDYTGTPTVPVPALDPLSLTGNKTMTIAPGTGVFKLGLNTSITYIVSYCTRSGPLNVNSSGPVITGRSVGSWIYYEHQLTAPAGSVFVNGTGTIDELRLYPKGALMTSLTWEPLVGVTSQSDPNNHINYYQYDNLGRLRVIRDQDKNIVKKICYNYAGQQEDCGAGAIYYNELRVGDFQRSDCGAGLVGGWYTHSVPEGAYNSTVDQATANALADNYLNSTGPALANQNAACVTAGTANVRLRNQFIGTGPHPVSTTVEFIQNGVVMQTRTFSATVSGSVNTTVPAGTYKVRFTVTSGFQTYPVSFGFSPQNTFVDKPTNTLTVTSSVYLSFNGGVLTIITASNSF